MPLEVIGLRKSYVDFALSLDLRVGTGETLALVGPSGSGKSTALSLIAGLAEPDSGRVIINGNDVSAIPCWKRNISIVFQDLALFPHLNVGGNVSYGLAMRKISRKERLQLAEEMLKIVRLPGYASRRIDSLSGGERQRVAIARSLATNPDALLLDEPFSSLDAPLRKAMNAEFLSMRSQSRSPCIFVTHDKEEAVMLGDRIALLWEGELIETGTGRELILEPKSERCARFFGAGQVMPCAICGSREAGLEVSSPLGILTVPGHSGFDPLMPKIFIPHDAVRLDDSGGGNPPCGAATVSAHCVSAIFEGERLDIQCLLNPWENEQARPSGERHCFNIMAPPRAKPPAAGDPVCFAIDQSLIRFVE